MLVAMLTDVPRHGAQPSPDARRPWDISIALPVTHFLRGCDHALDHRGNSFHPLDSRILRGSRRWRTDPSPARHRCHRHHLSPRHRPTSRLASGRNSYRRGQREQRKTAGVPLMATRFPLPAALSHAPGPSCRGKRAAGGDQRDAGRFPSESFWRHYTR